MLFRRFDFSTEIAKLAISLSFLQVGDTLLLGFLGVRFRNVNFGNFDLNGCLFLLPVVDMLIFLTCEAIFQKMVISYGTHELAADFSFLRLKRD